MGQKKLRRKPYRRRRWRSYLGFRGMTLRDWLPIVGALLIPVVLALGTWGITWQQGKIEERRAQAERELADQRAQDEALQAYLDQMSGLLLERDLRTSEEASEVRTLARAQTLAVLERLDPSRKTAVMEFLVEANLVQRTAGGGPIVRLSGAHLSDVNLFLADLSGADLGNALLDNATLSGVDLSDANLYGANLRGAELSVVNLRGANLAYANLRGANLVHAKLRDANLGGANLRDAKMRDANKQLSAAISLEGATMPNGQKYEDWLKSKN